MIARARENARGTPGDAQRRGLEPGQPALPLPLGAEAQRRFQASPSGSSSGIKQACILFDGLVDSTLPAERGLPLPPARPLPGAGRPDQPDLRTPRAATLHEPETGPRAPHAARPLDEPAAELLGLRSVPPEHHDRIEPAGVVRYLVLDPDFPRAVRFCVARCRESLHEIAGGDERRLRLRGRAPPRPARQRAALHRRRRDLRPRPPQLPATASRRPATASATRSTRRISRSD